MHLLHLPLYFGGNPLAGRAEIFRPSALEIFRRPFLLLRPIESGTAPPSSFVHFRAMLSPALSPPFLPLQGVGGLSPSPRAGEELCSIGLPVAVRRTTRGGVSMLLSIGDSLVILW